MNAEQRAVLEHVVAGHNVFMTGGAGVGKSFTLGHVIEWAEGAGKNVGVCAMTGAAAVLLPAGATTLHSFMGIGLGKDDVEHLCRKIKKKAPVLEKLKELDLLIVDEVSMLNDELFVKVSQVLKCLRRVNKPFGGVQMLLVGDPFQLMPVEGAPCFLSPEWADAGFTVCTLVANMRQKDDTEFKALLDRVRLGDCSSQDLATLQALKTTEFPPDIVPTRLYAINARVDEINEIHMERLLLDGRQAITYRLKYGGNASSKVLSKKWAETIKMRPEITLCVGAQVMLTRNICIESRLVNGARGVVDAVTPKTVSVRWTSGAISVVEFFKISTLKYPYKVDKQTDTDEEINVAYMPLQLAWAISIHKSQGMTLDAVEVDLGSSIFAGGQAYTALSRARSFDSIKLIDVRASSFHVNPRVLSLETLGL